MIRLPCHIRVRRLVQSVSHRERISVRAALQAYRFFAISSVCNDCDTLQTPTNNSLQGNCPAHKFRLSFPYPKYANIETWRKRFGVIIHYRYICIMSCRVCSLIISIIAVLAKLLNDLVKFKLYTMGFESGLDVTACIDFLFELVP